MRWQSRRWSAVALLALQFALCVLVRAPQIDGPLSSLVPSLIVRAVGRSPSVLWLRVFDIVLGRHAGFAWAAGSGVAR
jgi:hypothetical protein